MREDAIHVAPGKIKIEAGNDGLEDDFPKFQGCSLRFLVNLPGCILQKKKPFENSTCTESTDQKEVFSQWYWSFAQATGEFELLQFIPGIV